MSYYCEYENFHFYSEDRDDRCPHCGMKGIEVSIEED